MCHWNHHDFVLLTRAVFLTCLSECFIIMYFSHLLAFVDISLARCCFMLQHRPYVSNCMAYLDLLTNKWVKYNYIKWSYRNSNNGIEC